MAGNIIPAIATTNAIIAGMIVMQSFKVLNGKLDECKTVHIKIIIDMKYICVFFFIKYLQQ
jgi:ubiquitin-like 1-activating enzyme E1 B